MAICGEGPIRVLSVTSCPEGWEAVFTSIENGADLDTEPVACWLLVEHGAATHVHPAVAFPDGVSDATCAANYLGVISPEGDPEDLLAPTAPPSAS